MAVAGNINEERFSKKIHSLLPDLQEVDRTESLTTLNLENLRFTNIAQQALLQMTVQGVSLADELRMNNVPDVFNNGFGDGMYSLLFNRIREQLGLCYSIRSGHGSGIDYGHQEIQVALDDKQIDLAVEECNKLIQQVKRDGFSSELLEISKRNYLF